MTAAKNTGKNVYNNVNFAAERGEYRKSPEGYRLLKAFKNKSDARAEAYQQQVRGYRVKLEDAKDGYGHPVIALYIREGNGDSSISPRRIQKKLPSVRKQKTVSKPRNNLKGFTKNLFADTAAAARTAGDKLTGDNILRRWAENTVRDNFREDIVPTKKPAAKVKHKKCTVQKPTKTKMYAGKRYELAGVFKSVPAARAAVARLKSYKCAVRIVNLFSASGKESFAVYARRPVRVVIKKKRAKRSCWYNG